MANVKFTLDADEAKAVQGILRVMDANRKVENSFRQQKTVVGELKDSIKNYAAGFVGISTVAQGLRLFNEELERNAQLIKSAERQRTQTASLGAGDAISADKLRELESQYRQTAGVDAEKASSAVFAIRSIFSPEDIQDAVKFAGEADRFVVDSTKFAEGMGKVMNALGKQETGSVSELGNKMMAAAKFSVTEASDFGNELTKIAKPGASVGASDEFLMSSLAIGSAGDASTAEGATKIRAFLNEVNKKRVPGDTIEEKFENLLAQGINNKNVLGDFTGSNEAAAGFMMINDNYQQILSLRDQLTEEGKRANGSDSYLNKAILGAKSDKSLELPYQSRVLEQQLNLATENSGLQKIERENSVTQSMLLKAQKGDLSTFDKVVMEQSGRMFSNLPISPEATGGLTSAVGELKDFQDNISIVGLFSKLIDALERNTKATEKTAPAPGMSRNNGVVE